MPLSNKRAPCPLCRSEGKDSTGNHLRLFEDGTGGWCYHGHGKVMLDGGDSGMEYSRPSNRGPNSEALSLSVVNTYPIRPYPDRKISQATMDRYGVRCESDTSTGDPAALYYPYHSEDGSTTGYKKRRLDDKSFMVVGKPKGLFGQKACKPNAKFVIIVEGEQDVLAAWELLQSRGKDWNVVSIPNGANEEGVLDKQTLSALEWIASHPGVCLALDADKPGKATAKALAEALVSQTEVKIANLSPRKDTADYWEAGDVTGWFKCINGAVTYRPEAVVEGCDIDVEVLMTPKEPGIELPYPKLQRMTWGLRKGEITLLTAGSGIGKSTFARELTYHVINEKFREGYKIAVIALETQMEDVARMMVAIDNNIPAHKLMFNPNCITREQYVSSVGKLFHSNRMHFFKHWGSIAAPTLKQKMHYYAKVLGVDFIVLDHVSMVVAGSDTSDERKDIDMLFEGMTQVTNETGVGILPVIHLKRSPNKKFNKGDEVELTDLRGCVDKDTEFLTPNGWKKISEWDNDLVMVVDENLVGRSEYCELLALPCREGFTHFKTNRLDMMLSDEHRIMYHTEKDKTKLREITVEDALRLHEEQATGFRGLIPCVLNGTANNSPFLSEAEVRVHVMVSSDGWIRNKDTGRCSVRVKKDRKKARARELLSAYTDDWFEFDIKGGYTEFTFTAPLKEKGYRLFFNQGVDVLRWVADEIKYWDGELATGRVSSVSKIDADFLQLAYTVCGHRAPLSVRERDKCFDGKYDAQTQYTVNLTNETHASFRKAPNSKCEITRVPSVDGMKYCFVTSTGAWLARRNGKIFVTGNSAGAEQMSFNVWALERNQQGETKDLVKIRVLKNRLLGFTGEADTLRYDHDTGRLMLHTIQEFD